MFGYGILNLKDFGMKRYGFKLKVLIAHADRLKPIVTLSIDRRDSNVICCVM